METKNILYELVWRDFQRTLAHQVILHVSPDEIKNGGWIKLFRNGGAGYYKASYDKFLYSGFPLPEHGGIPIPSGNRFKTRVFMDDVFLCPDCGELHLGSATSRNDNLPEIPWLDYSRTHLADKEAMLKAIDLRKNTREFEIRHCANRSYCEYFLKTVKDIHNRASREISFTAKQKCRPHVYLIGSSSYIKIGIATNVSNRLAALQTSSPHPLKVIKSWNCKNAKDKEKRLHKKFKDFRQKGEWFCLPNEVVEQLLAIKSLDDFLENQD